MPVPFVLPDCNEEPTMQLTRQAAKRLDQLPQYLQVEFPGAPMAAIEHDLDESVRNLIATAHFDNYVPLLALKAVRDRLLAMN